jgi:hypothetical protein
MAAVAKRSTNKKKTELGESRMTTRTHPADTAIDLTHDFSEYSRENLLECIISRLLLFLFVNFPQVG